MARGGGTGGYQGLALNHDRRAYCCVKRIALKAVAGALTSEGGTTFSGEDDPELVAEALPFAMKTYESLLASLPNDPKLNYVTGKTFTMYAYAFVQYPADTLPDQSIDKKNEQLLRAKKLYLRGRDYILTALTLKHKSFRRLLDNNKIDSAMAITNKADTSMLYWAAMSWMGAFTADKFDLGLLVDIKKPVAMMNRVSALNPDYAEGSLYDFYISFYGAMPKAMGGDKAKARESFKKAIELSKGSRLGPYIALATAISVPEQNVAEFRELLNTALAINIDTYPANRLVNTLAHRRAQWMLDNIGTYFLSESGTDSDESFPPNDSADVKAPEEPK